LIASARLSVTARLSEYFQRSEHFFLEGIDFGEEPTDEQARNIMNFENLDKSVVEVSSELIEQTIQLRALNEEAFENSVSAMCSAVCDTFRPATAAVEKANEDIRSELGLSKSKGRERGACMRQLEAMADGN
jgi:hypothetical protein